MPTGSFAPDSPFEIVPARPETSRWPRTENTTAGSVGATAVATSTETYQASPNAKCASSAAAITVKNVPSTPVKAIGASADRNRAQPTSIPPSNKMQASATDTTCSTACCDGPCTAGITLAAIARTHQEQRSSGELYPVSQPIRYHRGQPRPSYHHDQQGKRRGAGHAGAPPGRSWRTRLPTRLPGAPPPSLAGAHGLAIVPASTGRSADRFHTAQTGQPDQAALPADPGHPAMDPGPAAELAVPHLDPPCDNAQPTAAKGVTPNGEDDRAAPNPQDAFHKGSRRHPGLARTTDPVSSSGAQSSRHDRAFTARQNNLICSPMMIFAEEPTAAQADIACRRDRRALTVGNEAPVWQSTTGARSVPAIPAWPSPPPAALRHSSATCPSEAAACSCSFGAACTFVKYVPRVASDNGRFPDTMALAGMSSQRRRNPPVRVERQRQAGVVVPCPAGGQAKGFQVELLATSGWLLAACFRRQSLYPAGARYDPVSPAAAVWPGAGRRWAVRCDAGLAAVTGGPGLQSRTACAGQPDREGDLTPPALPVISTISPGSLQELPLRFPDDGLDSRTEPARTRGVLS